jgi:predicted nucleic acid-binding protein
MRECGTSAGLSTRPDMALVADASVGLKWVLQEPDSYLAEALLAAEPDLLLPDFWLGEATNVLWLQVRRKRLTPDEARTGLALLRDVIEPVCTADMDLHEVALDIGLAINHSTYDTLYVAFAIAMGATGIVIPDAPFVRAMQTHSDPDLAAMLIPLDAWARSRHVD